MKEIKKRLELPKLDYYITHLSIINCILPEDTRLTPMEIKVLASFMSLEGDIAEYRFGPTGRKVVMQELNISMASLSNYLSSLKSKNFLLKTGDIIQIFPILIPEQNEQVYLLKLINKNATTNTASGV